jgi:hypothetical protein
MEYWEFLLQKEGDRSWVPVKSPKLELEAGRYRVVAHSSRANTDVEIYVTHHSTEEVPPKRRSQKRSRRTNPEGLMVIIPFTYLKPGLWELRCCGDIMSDFLGTSWQQAVELHVLPKAADVSLNHKPTSPVADATQAEVQSDLSETVHSNSELADKPQALPAQPSRSVLQESQNENSSSPTPHSSSSLIPSRDSEFPTSNFQVSGETTEAPAPREQMENSSVSGVQPSELTHEDSASKLVAQEAEAVEEPKTDSSSLLSSEASSTAPALPTPQDELDIVLEPVLAEFLFSSDAQEPVEPAPTEIEASSVVSPLVAEAEELGTGDEALEMALEGRDSEQQEELDKAQPVSEINQSLDYLLVEDFSVPSPFYEASLPMEENVANFEIEAGEEDAPVERRSDVVENSIEASAHPHVLASPIPNSQSSEEVAIPPLAELEQEIFIEPVDDVESVPTNPVEPVVFLEAAESEENQTPLTSSSAEVAMPSNPILDRSLQMLEQVLQQVLEPVMQEFEQPEPTESQLPVAPEVELPLEIDANLSGLGITLDAEALVARREEPLTISGQVNILEGDRLNGRQGDSTSNPVFQGTLRYQLRDPQTSQVLIDVQQSLPEQALPLAFSHSLEIPPDCHTRLFLGNATLYSSTSVPLASQPFSVTADLDELLGAILPGTKVMPVAKMLVHSDTPAASQEDNQAEPPQTASPSLSQAFVDLVNSPQSRQPLPLQPASAKPLPPQIYQPSPERKISKSPQLPKLPNIRSITTVDSSVTGSTPNTVEVKPDDRVGQLPPSELSVVSQHLAPANDFSPKTLPQELGDKAEDTTLESEPEDAPESTFQAVVPTLEDAATQEAPLSVEDWDDFSSNTLDATELSVPPVSVADSQLSLQEAIPSEIASPHATLDNSASMADEQVASSDQIESPNSATPADDFPLSDWESIEWLETLEPQMRSAEFHKAQAAAIETIAVDNAFQALRLQDRFWTRLNSMAADAELSQWLKSDVDSSMHSADEVDSIQELNFDAVVFDEEDVTQPLNSDVPVTDFDESIWAEESEDVGSAIDDIAQLQSPATTELQSPDLEEASPASEAAPEQPPLAAHPMAKWAAQEIVVEDDEELFAPEPSVFPEPLAFREDKSERVYPSRQLSSQPKPKSFSPRQVELPLPAPTLFIPKTELPAGEPVTIRAKVPPHSARLCIKLWVQDRHSRSLLDGPRWLVDLLPDGTGKLEAMTQLIIPFGAVEIRFEAIAVDLDSQRESHKVTVDCVVVPPDIPDLSLDEFEQ